MLQENLKNQRDSVRQGLDTSQTGHVILTGNFWMKILSSYRSSLVLSFKKYNQFCCFCFFISWTPNGSVPQNTCSSGKFFLAWRCGRKDMSLEGGCCYEKENSGRLRGFDVYNSCYVLFFYLFSPSLKMLILPVDHTQTSQWCLDNTSARKLASMSGCRS